MKAVGGAAGDDVALDVAGGAAGFEIHGLPISRYASAATASTATEAGKARLQGEGLPVVTEIGDEPKPASAGKARIGRQSAGGRRLRRQQALYALHECRSRFSARQTGPLYVPEAFGYVG